MTENSICALCYEPNHDLTSDHLRTVYKISQDKFDKGTFRPRLFFYEMNKLQLGFSEVCSNRRKCRERMIKRKRF